MINVKALEDKLDKDSIPQFLFLDNELIITLPDRTFLYFPRDGLTYRYITREDLFNMIEYRQTSRMFACGNVYLPKPKDTT